MARISRRQVLFGGAGIAVLGTGWWGRYALGDTFENHVAKTLGLDPAVGAELVVSLRERVDDYEARAAAFLFATTSPSRDVMPRAAREEAVEAFIGPLVGMENALITPLAIAGRRRSGSYQPCRVLRT